MDPVVRFVKQNSAELESGGKSFEDVYRIVFRNEENVMAETSSGFSIIKYTYGEVKSRIERLAPVIAARSRDSFIGLWAENCVEWIILFWAILKSGNKPFLMNLMQPIESTEGIMHTLGANTVFYVGKAPEIDAELISFEELESSADAASPEVFGNEIALTTSGTTLKQKICIYSGREISEQILNCDRIIEKNPDIKEFYHGSLKMLMFLPLYHIFGLEASYLWFAFGNITFVFLQSMAPDVLLHTIRRHEVTHIFGVPLLWHTIEKTLKRQLASYDEKTVKKLEKGLELSLRIQSFAPKLGRKIAARMLKEVRSQLFGDSVLFCISGGSYIRSSALRLINALGYPLYNGYGMSEIGITSVELSRNVRQRLKGSIGKPFNSVEYRLDKEGVLSVRGSSVCKRVIIDGKEQTADDWFETGDIMHVEKDGRYYIDGRRSDLVFGDNGENLNPDVAERGFALSNAESFTVMGDENNENLILIVQIPRTLLLVQKERLAEEIRRCNENLPTAYRIRKAYYTYDPLTSGESIKVSRAFVRHALASGRIKLFDSIESASHEAGEASEEIFSAVREVFASVLDRPENEIDPEAHFMNDLGGSSLDYFTLISEIDKRFGITMNFEDGDFSYTLNDFAEKAEGILKKL